MARQKLGQHFLSSGKALELIARAACGDHVGLAVEIGPGRGALTEYLLPRADRVVALELDSELVRQLRDRWGSDSRIEIVETNALHANLAGWGPGVLVGNLPYYAATAIISRFLRAPGELSPGVFLIQKEVAERITAKPGSRDYGYLSVECQLLATTEYLSTVPPGAFKPPPKVDSAVVRLIPRVQDLGFPADGLLGFVSACFRQKRKTLRNNLGGLYSRETLGDMPDLSRRAEELSVTEFVELQARLGAARGA